MLHEALTVRSSDWGPRLPFHQGQCHPPIFVFSLSTASVPREINALSHTSKTHQVSVHQAGRYSLCSAIRVLRGYFTGARLNDSHTKPENTDTTCSSQAEGGESNMNRQVCTFWQEGKCGRGRSCKFLHTYGQKERSYSRSSRQFSTSLSDCRRNGISSGRSEGAIPNAPLEQPVSSDESGVRNEGRTEDNSWGRQENNSPSVDQENDDDLRDESEIEDGEQEVPLGVKDVWNTVHGHEQDQISLVTDQEYQNDVLVDQLKNEGDKSLDTISPDDYASVDNHRTLSPGILQGDQETQLEAQTTIDSYTNKNQDGQGSGVPFVRPTNSAYTHVAEDSQDHQGTQGVEERNNIRILHWTEYADPQANPFVAFCKFFARGRCNHEASCTYRHALTVQEYFLLFRLEPNAWSSTVQTPYEDNQTPLPSQPSSSLGACAFHPLGKCRNGEKCPYAHIKAPDPGLEFDGQDQGGWKEDNEDSHEQSDLADGKRQVCKYFLRNELCWRGDACYFSHERSDSDFWTNEPANDWNQGPSGWDALQNTDTKENGAARGTNIESQDEKTENNGNMEESNSGQPGSRDDSGWGKNEGTTETLTNGTDNDVESPRISPQQSSSRQNDSQRRIPCRHYLRGSCRNDWGCRFAHENDESVNIDPINNKWTNDDRPKNNWSRTENDRTEDNWSQQWSTGGTSSHDAWNVSPPKDHSKDDGEPSKPENKCDTQRENEDQGVFYDADVIAERSMYNCIVSFGAGSQVQGALTTSDPKRIILRNIPSKHFLKELKRLPIEGLHRVRIDGPTKPENALLEFGTQLQTLQALRVLKGHKLPGSTLSIHLYADQMADAEDTDPNCEVRVTWPAPRRIAWARYNSVTHAKEDAARLDGQIFEGRKIAAEFCRPGRGQTTMLAVQISNLPPEITETSIKQRCQECQFVNLLNPTYVSSPVERIREMLSQHGPLITFNAPYLPSSEETMIAFAKFDSGGAATAAVEAMADFKADFLGEGGFFKVESIHRSQFDIQPDQYRLIQSDLERLQATYHQECSILIISTDEHVTIHVHAPIKDGSTFAKLLASLSLLVYGEVLRQDGKIVWDDYFNSASSAKVIDAINAENNKDYNVLVKPDHRAQRIIILGEQVNRPRAKESVLKILKKVRIAWNEVPFDRIFVRWYLEQGQNQIHSDPDIGQNKVSLDLTAPKLVVRGDSKVLKKVKERISNAVTIRSGTLDETSWDICHICLNKPTSPITLCCKHQYCKSCLETLLASAVENIHVPLKCIAKIDDSRCDRDLPYVAIQDLLPMANEERLFRAYFLAYVRSNTEGLFFCPSPQCDAVHRHSDTRTSLQCSTCGIDICPSCRTKYHPGVNCDQWREIALI
ncbi:hypothetical protein AX15_002132 [Amanita polypyramis BW_CC]|nr:hypothetical protein AX15_002132 [Amanita polypyramis BW_CC]